MSVKPQTIRLGTRGSPLALKQAGMVRAALGRAAPDIKLEIVIIKTSGDWKPEDGETRLAEEQGGKGQFAKEIEEALLQEKIDAGVHSMKDMETFLPEGLIIPCMLEREDARDALLLHERSRTIRKLEDLPEGITVGTSSVRREAFLRVRRPDLKIVSLRGNVETRIAKLRGGQVDATFLACAGLKRLELEHEVDVILEPEEMLPAAGQGAIGIEMRKNNSDMLEMLERINCRKTLVCVTAERAVLAVLEGSCHTPIGAYAIFEGKFLYLRVMVAAPDGSAHCYEEERQEALTVEEAAAFGAALGQRLKSRVPADLFKGTS